MQRISQGTGDAASSAPLGRGRSQEDRDAKHRDLTLRPRNLKEGADEDREERKGTKKVQKAPKTLKIVFDTLVERRVEIELRNDTTISGILDAVDECLNLELSCVRYRRRTDASDTHLEILFLNGRYIRYVHIPRDVEIVRAVQSRVYAQNKAKNSHRRTADIIREAIARREGVRNAQEEAISSVSPDSGGQRPALLRAVAATRIDPLATIAKETAMAVKNEQDQVAAVAAGFDDISLTCRDCKAQFVWTARQQKMYQEKGLSNAPKRCLDCLKKQRERRKERESRDGE